MGGAAPADGPAACPECGVVYSQRRNLTEHMKKHRGEARCPICRQDFSARRNLRKHMVRRHGMAQAEVDSMTRKRLRMPIFWNETAAAAAPVMAPARAGAASTTASAAPPAGRGAARSNLF